MYILLILALTLHPATAKPVNRVVYVYSCPVGSELYIRVNGGAKYLESLGVRKDELEGTGIVIVGEQAFYRAGKEKEAPQADDRHYCVAK